MSRAKVIYSDAWKPAADRAIERVDEAAWWARLGKLDRRYLLAKAKKARTLEAVEWPDLLPTDQRAIVSEAHHAAIVMADRTALL